MGQSVSEVWMSQADACRELQVSRSTLYRLRMQGHLLPVQHFYRSGGMSGSGPLLFNVPDIRLTMRANCWG